jgi:hypothetical protein
MPVIWAVRDSAVSAQFFMDRTRPALSSCVDSMMYLDSRTARAHLGADPTAFRQLSIWERGEWPGGMPATGFMTNIGPTIYGWRTDSRGRRYGCGFGRLNGELPRIPERMAGSKCLGTHRPVATHARWADRRRLRFSGRHGVAFGRSRCGAVSRPPAGQQTCRRGAGVSCAAAYFWGTIESVGSAQRIKDPR